MKKVKGLVVLGSFIFINGIGFAVTYQEFNAHVRKLNSFQGQVQGIFNDQVFPNINNLNSNVSKLENQVADLNKFKDVVDKNMEVINRHVVLKDGTNLNPTDFRKNLDVYSKTEVNNSLNSKANASDLTELNNKFNQAMNFVGENAVRNDGTNLKVTDFREKLDVYSKTEVNNSLKGKANASDVADLKKQVTNLNQTMTTVNGKADANNVYTKSEVDTSLSNKVNKDEVHTKTEVNNLLGSKVDKNEVYTKAEVDNTLNGKADANNVYTKNEVDTSLGNKVNKDEVHTKSEVNDLLKNKVDTNDVYTKAEINTTLDNKVNKDEVHTKTEVNNLLGSKADSNNVYTKSEVDNSLKDKADSSNVYTKIEINKLLATQTTGTSNNVITNAATGKGSLAFGEGTTASGNYSTAVGYKNTVSGNNSGAFGDPNIVTGNGSYAFGNDNTINGNNNFVLGNNVTIGSSIQNSVALGNNSTVSSSNEVSVGSATQKRKITNVADGEVSATSTDAVTGKQLYNAMQNSGAVGVENLRNEISERLDNVKSEVRTVGSLSAALAGLHPMQYDPKAPSQIMAAIGHYKNKQAVAVGMSYYFNDRFMVSTGVAISEEKRTKSMANVGFTLKLGKGSGVAYNETPQYIVQNEVKRLTVENQDLKERVKNLEDKLNKVLEGK